MIQLLFSEVRFTDFTAAPIVILSELNGERQLPIWTNAAAGAAIVSAMEAESADHPATHDLMLEVLSSLNAKLEEVRITSGRDGVFGAQLQVNGHAVVCRPSDGIALALRCGAPIYVAEAVLAEYGVVPGDTDVEPDPEADEVKQFREFLANVRAEDFEQPES